MNCYWGCFFLDPRLRYTCSLLFLHCLIEISAGRRQVEFNRHSGEDESSRGRRHHPSPRDRVGPLLAGWGYLGLFWGQDQRSTWNEDIQRCPKVPGRSCTAKNTVNTWKGHWHFLCRPHLWGVAAKKYWVLSTLAGARYSPVFGLRGLDLWICVSICVSNCCCFFLKHVEVTEVIASVQLF